MGDVFLKLFNMSIAAGWLILFVLLLRLLFRKMPSWVRCILWAIVAFRLLCPFSLESMFSLIPSGEILSADTVRYAAAPAITSGISSLDGALNPVISQVFAPEPVSSVNPLYVVMYLAGLVWLIGLLLLIGYALFGYLRLKRRVREAVHLRDNIWVCDAVTSPFLFGVINPKIYLSSTGEDSQQTYVLAHEQAHLKRKDHWWKLLGYLLLSVYWFHPLVWAAYFLFCRDIELACDEKVIREFDVSEKKAYCHALLSCGMQRTLLFTCPLSFGEVSVKKRVKSILHYRKPAAFVTIGALVLCAAVALCFLTNPAPKYFLNHVDPSEVSAITVFDGNNGQGFTITDPQEITVIVENIQSIPVKRENWSLTHSGYRFRMTFTDQSGKEITQFILNSDNNIRKDPFFYSSQGGFCYSYIEELEQRYLS
ncbi:MAG: M56 family metallopeptidase [Fusicatenibacter sp.]